MRLVLLCLLLAPFLGGLTPYRQLEESLTQAQAEYAKLEAHRQTLQKEQKQELEAAFKAQSRLLQLQSWPPALSNAAAILEGAPPPAVLLASLGKNAQINLTHLGKSLQKYTDIQTQATEEMRELESLKSAFAGEKKRLSKLEKQALESAGAKAEALAEHLQNAFKQTPERQVVRAMKNFTKLPVPGRVIYEFEQAGAPATQTEGLTFMAPSGSAVTAVGTGQVIYAGPFRHLGGLVIVKTGRLHVLYGGVEDISVRVGQTVKEGAKIGTIAKQGERAMLYLEVRRAGRPINPASLLTSRR
ncbi:MAG: hypothetical protein COY40_01375 [Alphaproteobacteria bacterium CG_4_10_14_0_8_um_filter_53_9]|nr:MAG: hypothetical protein COY40_01375 [Alphaproteobacteria bacterium CG_4_10_14_0_8_um_filter_53_9]